MACAFDSIDEVEQEICNRILADPDITDAMELAQYAKECSGGIKFLLNTASQDIADYTVGEMSYDTLKQRHGCEEENTAQITFESSPSAKVYVDGIYKGTT